MALNSSLRHQRFRKGLRDCFSTTIAVINSAILKLTKETPLAENRLLYRGISGVSLPDILLMFGKDECRGFVEFAFSSASPNRHVALQYSGALGCKGPLGCSIECQKKQMSDSEMEQTGCHESAIVWYIFGSEHANGIIFSSQAAADDCWSSVRDQFHDQKVKESLFWDKKALAEKEARLRTASEDQKTALKSAIQVYKQEVQVKSDALALHKIWLEACKPHGTEKKTIFLYNGQIWDCHGLLETTQKEWMGQLSNNFAYGSFICPTCNKLKDDSKFYFATDVTSEDEEGKILCSTPDCESISCTWAHWAEFKMKEWQLAHVPPTSRSPQGSFVSM